MTTGKRIKEQRMKRGITQVELAEAIGCSPQVISNIERSYSGCSSALVAKIAEVFSVPADHLLKKDYADSFFLTKEEKAFMLRYRALKPNEERLIRCTVDSCLTSE